MAPQVGFEPGKTLLRQTNRTHSIQATTRLSGLAFGLVESVSDSERDISGTVAAYAVSSFLNRPSEQL